MSEMYKLGANDFVKGAVTAVFAAVLTTLYGVSTQGDFNVFTTDWSVVLNQVIQISITTMIAYLAKNLISDSQGNVAGLN